MIASASLLLAEGNITTTTEVTTPEVAVKAVETKPAVVAPVVFTPKCKCITPTNCNCVGECRCKNMKRQNRNQNSKGMNRGMNRGKYGNRNFNKNKKRANRSQLLINRGLTPLLRVVMMSSKDPLLGLNVEQFTQLSVIKKDIIPRSQKLRKELRTLRHSTTVAIASGATVDAVKADIERLGAIKAEQTLLRIECINKTKAVLNKDQIIYLLGKSVRKNSNHKKRWSSKKCNSKKCASKRYYKHR